MGGLSILWTIALLAFNPNQDVLGDTISALGFAVCFYYGFTGLACAVYFRREVFKSVRNFVFAGLIPVVGGLMMGYVAVKAYSYYNTAGNNYSKPVAGIQTPIFVGIGGLVVGVVLMFASWPFHRGFFRRKGLEAADPAVLEADAHYRANPVVGE
jgi:O-antigen ligase